MLFDDNIWNIIKQFRFPKHCWNVYNIKKLNKVLKEIKFPIKMYSNYNPFLYISNLKKKDYQFIILFEMISFNLRINVCLKIIYFFEKTENIHEYILNNFIPQIMT